MWSWSNGLRAPTALKVGAAVVLDVLDFTLGRAPLFGMGFDAVSAGVSVLLWGWKGALALWEIADPTEQADGFVPTHTLIALAALRARKDQSDQAASEGASSASAPQKLDQRDIGSR